jgi:hypothetical protein
MVLGLLSSSTKFSGVPDYWVPDGILLYWEVIWWGGWSCMLYRIVITSVLGHCLQRLIWVHIVNWSDLWNIKICAYLKALLIGHINQLLYYSGIFTVIQLFWYIKRRWIWLQQIRIMIHIIVIQLIKIVNCGKDYVMICVCVCVCVCVHISYIKFIIIFNETCIHV